MAAAYDTYDYPSYWISREYENKSEQIAINSFLNKIPRVNTILDIGGGFGRLTPTYKGKAKNIILSDPSSKLLKIAKEELKDNNIIFVQSSLQDLPKKLKIKNVDIILIVRVLHHIEDLDKACSMLNKLLKQNGFLILEFANKKHLKATLCEFFKGNFTFPLDIFPKELTPKRKSKDLPFLNYHPDIVFEKIEANGFEIIDKRSVSNTRSKLVKIFVSTKILLFFEKILQKPLSLINFGPSIFVLARKK